MAQLWEALPAWLGLETELAEARYELSECVKSIALEKLIPLEIQKVIVSRMDLVEYQPKLEWIQAQMAHNRGETQAQALERR